MGNIRELLDSLDSMKEEYFKIDIKGLVFSPKGQLMLLREPSGVWDLPGGIMDHGETPHEALRRECREEMGVDCHILDEVPLFFWMSRWRGDLLLYFCFRIKLSSFSFQESDECCGYNFFSAGDLSAVRIRNSIRPLRGWMRTVSSRNTFKAD